MSAAKNSTASLFRRLPTELLAEIFDLCVPLGQEVVSDTTTPTDEVERLAKKYLLQLAQVCSHWHSVAMGTPDLWSSIVIDTGVWSSSSLSSQTLLKLVASSLQRGAECPLTLRVAVDHGDPNEASVLKLISEHSHRWRRAHMWIDSRSFQFLARAKGNLGRLRSLKLMSPGPGSRNDASTNDIFQVAPRLSAITLCDWHDEVPILPWRQLLHLTFGTGGLGEILPFLSTVGTLFITRHTVRNLSRPLRGRVCSELQTLIVRLVEEFPLATSILGPLFQSLTLPRLDAFKLFRKGVFPRWDQGPFLEFASRSSLQNTLTVFRIDVVIEDHELLQCLSVLPLLDELYIADSDYHSHPALLTDNLLQTLTRRPDETCLVPSLFFFQLTSRFTFRDDVFWAFITSRVLHRHFSYAFQVEAYWCKSREHGFATEFDARLKELAGKDFKFTTGRDPDA
ncbi:hypothetical protein C8R46DRAFT_1341664 [Mycena filopes]|nr:hypothetical protein C8R46DRAFT_1341664 [Mycena filopes]